MKPISSEQREFLGRLTNGRHDYFDCYKTLVGLVQEEEALDPRWRELWPQLKEFVERHGFATSPAIRRMQDAVSRIEVLDEKLKELRVGPDDQVCLLLGAGASAPMIPTVTKLLPELWRRARKIGRDDIDRLANWCEDHKITNIEDLLTAAYLANFTAKNASVTELLDYFLYRAGDAGEEDGKGGRGGRRLARVDAASIALLQDTLQVLFGLLTGTMIPAHPNEGHAAIVKFVAAHHSTSIVTTNYDGCVDEALIQSGIPLNTFVDESTPKDNALALIKIHGSINWTYCDSCHSVRDFDLIKLKTAYENDTASYAVIGICKSCGGQRRPLLIPPLGFKFIIFPNLIRLWNSARERIEQAKYIIVIGYSFSEADAYINKIIERSMTLNPAQRIIVCDPNPRLVQLLRNRYASRIDDFDVNRILSALGPATVMVPKVLKQLLPTEAVAVEQDQQALNLSIDTPIAAASVEEGISMASKESLTSNGEAYSASLEYGSTVASAGLDGRSSELAESDTSGDNRVR